MGRPHFWSWSARVGGDVGCDLFVGTRSRVESVCGDKGSHFACRPGPDVGTASPIPFSLCSLGLALDKRVVLCNLVLDGLAVSVGHVDERRKVLWVARNRGNNIPDHLERAQIAHIPIDHHAVGNKGVLDSPHVDPLPLVPTQRTQNARQKLRQRVDRNHHRHGNRLGFGRKRLLPRLSLSSLCLLSLLWEGGWW